MGGGGAEVIKMLDEAWYAAWFYQRKHPSNPRLFGLVLDYKGAFLALRDVIAEVGDK